MTARGAVTQRLAILSLMLLSGTGVAGCASVRPSVQQSRPFYNLEHGQRHAGRMIHLQFTKEIGK